MRSLIPSMLALSILGALPAPALAQQPAPSDTVKEVARQRYNDGVKAFDAGKFEDARLAFSQAHQLTQAPGILFNLGISEVRTNRCIEGGNHLFQFMREYKEAAPEQKATSIQAIEECKKKAALISITVDVSGADVSIDGALAGKSPMNDPVFVEAGARTVVASHAGKNAMAKVEAKKGQVVAANVQFNPTTAPVEPPPGPVQSGPGPVQPGPGPGPGPMQPGPPPTQPVGPPPPAPDTAGDDFGTWFTEPSRAWPAWLGTGLFAAGLGVGIGFTVASAQSAADADSIAAQIRERADDQNIDGSPCGPEDSNGSQDLDGYRNACNQLRDALDIHSANVAVAVVGWVVAGLSAGGTIAYTVVDYQAWKKERRNAQPAPSFTLVPVVTPSVQGASVIGRF
jgi:hypothetical protein